LAKEDSEGLEGLLADAVADMQLVTDELANLKDATAAAKVDFDAEKKRLKDELKTSLQKLNGENTQLGADFVSL